MKIGDLVKIKRASLGIPAGTLGLITQFYYPAIEGAEWPRGICELLLLGPFPGINRKRKIRFLLRHLEKAK